jgi:hypothetical protein
MLIKLINTEPGTYLFTPDHRLLVVLPTNATSTEVLDTATATLKLLSP